MQDRYELMQIAGTLALIRRPAGSPGSCLPQVLDVFLSADEALAALDRALSLRLRLPVAGTFG